jgi:hypothetical protein
MLFGPSLLTVVLGVVFGRRNEPRAVLYAVIAGVALTVAVHVPDFLYLM